MKDIFPNKDGNSSCEPHSRLTQDLSLLSVSRPPYLGASQGAAEARGDQGSLGHEGDKVVGGAETHGVPGVGVVGAGVPAGVGEVGPRSVNTPTCKPATTSIRSLGSARGSSRY